MRFCSEYAKDLITETLKFQNKFSFDQRFGLRPKFECFKYGWKNAKIPICLEVSPASLDQVAESSNIFYKQYSYKDIKQIILVADRPGGFIVEVGEQRRRVTFRKFKFLPNF